MIKWPLARKPVWRLKIEKIAGLLTSCFLMLKRQGLSQRQTPWTLFLPHTLDEPRPRENFLLQTMSCFQGTLFLSLLSLIMLESQARASRRKNLPPSWKTPTTTSPSDVSSAYAPHKTARIPWYRPKVALGGGLHFPEIFPLEAFLLFGEYGALRFFFAPEYPFHARVEMPSDVISAKKGLGVANPEFTINLDVSYGPQYGFETLVFPFGQSFFAGAGISLRSMSIEGEAQSNVLVCSLIEAAKDPPCGNPAARIETQTELRIEADLRSHAELGRVVIGGFWHIGSHGYFTVSGGLTSPLKVRRSSRVRASLDTPASVDNDVTGALAEIKQEKEVELGAKALKEMRPVDERILPLLGFSLGIRL